VPGLAHGGPGAHAGGLLPGQRRRAGHRCGGGAGRRPERPHQRGHWQLRLAPARRLAGVYDGGFGFGKYTFTQGQVVTNFRSRGGSLLRHENLHIWQNRLFGPIYPLSYYGWEIVGAAVGCVLGLFVRQPLLRSIQDVAYLDNPWETWAYQFGGTPDGGALCWTHGKAATM
jgi:hypothetical protein